MGEKGVRADPKILDLSNWKDGVGTNWGEECRLGCGGGAPPEGKISNSVSDVLGLRRRLGL